VCRWGGKRGRVQQQQQQQHHHVQPRRRMDPATRCLRDRQVLGPVAHGLPRMVLTPPSAVR